MFFFLWSNEYKNADELGSVCTTIPQRCDDEEGRGWARAVVAYGSKIEKIPFSRGHLTPERVESSKVQPQYIPVNINHSGLTSDFGLPK